MPSAPKRRKRVAQTSPDGLDPNRVVAFNLRKARLRKGWTQETATEELARHIGGKWSVANWSSAERSVSAEPSRVRNFTVSDVYAFARTFDLPVVWFLMPPLPGDLPEKSALPEPTTDDVLAILETMEVQTRKAMLRFEFPEKVDEAIAHAAQKVPPRRSAKEIKRQAKVMSEAESDVGRALGRTPEYWERILREADRTDLAREVERRTAGPPPAAAGRVSVRRGGQK